MPRPKKMRWISNEPSVTYFKPHGVPMRGLLYVSLEMDELEAVRLADLKNLNQEEAAAKMNVSRATFGRIVAGARNKIADALVNGKAIEIHGGNVAPHPQFTPGRGRHRYGRNR